MRGHEYQVAPALLGGDDDGFVNDLASQGQTGASHARSRPVKPSWRRRVKENALAAEGQRIVRLGVESGNLRPRHRWQKTPPGGKHPERIENHQQEQECA